MATAADIARFTGPYNLPDGEVPIIDGTPRWPWDEAVARLRLARVAAAAGLRLSSDEVFVESGSNDAWLLPETVLRVCWRGDIDRLVREAELAAVLPEGVPGPRVVDHGRVDGLSWMRRPVRAEISVAFADHRGETGYQHSQWVRSRGEH